MNNWAIAGSAFVVTIAIFCATAPQRELARREIQRQDALEKANSESALLDARIRQSKQLLSEISGE
jgi:hypothetical protein